MNTSELKLNLIKLNEISRKTKLQEINLFIDKNKETLFAQIYDFEHPASIWNLLKIEEIGHFVAKSSGMWIIETHSLDFVVPGSIRSLCPIYKRNDPSDWMQNKYDETTINKVTDTLNNILDLFEIAYNNGFSSRVNKNGFHFI
jgi:hypothetical protein